MEASSGSLDHSTRSRLLDLIRREPGLSLMELVRSIGLAEGTLRYHLKYMERKDLIQSERIDGRKRYFSPETKHLKKVRRKGLEIGLSGKQRRLMDLIGSNPGIDQKRLCRLSRFNRFVVSYHLDKFEKLGIVKKERSGRNVLYHKTDENELRRRIISAMVEDLSKGKMDEERFLRLMDDIDKK
jgi:predicted transcriptional regulator